jgi:PIN domain nuclease of toxin-antitoxin system
MTTYVLDASAVIRYLDNEPGTDRVFAIFNDCDTGRASVCLSAVQWGEIAGNVRRRCGPVREAEVLSGELPKGTRVIPADADQAVRAARLKVDHGISYADAFALDLTMRSADHVLITADYGFKAVEDLAKIEFLPTK